MIVSDAEDRTSGRLVIRAIYKGRPITAENLLSFVSFPMTVAWSFFVKVEGRVISVCAMKAFMVSGNIAALIITLGTR